MEEGKKENIKMNIQLLTAIVLVVFGMLMVAFAIWVDPRGEIHGSVVGTFGEILAFSGALFGVDYSYKWKNKKDNEQ